MQRITYRNKQNNTKHNLSLGLHAPHHDRSIKISRFFKTKNLTNQQRVLDGGGSPSERRFLIGREPLKLKIRLCKKTITLARSGPVGLFWKHNFGCVCVRECNVQKCNQMYRYSIWYEHRSIWNTCTEIFVITSVFMNLAFTFFTILLADASTFAFHRVKQDNCSDRTPPILTSSRCHM